MVMIGHASGDEHGNVHGGAAGDQTGCEVCTRAWYNRPWDTVIRCTDAAIADKIATAMEYACKNDHIGYDQYQRTTLYAAVNALGWYPANIGKVTSNVETDCSALVAVCVNAAMGYEAVSKDIYTGNEASALLATGRFKKLTESKYLTSADYLQRGDILINTVHHTAICLTDGSKACGSAQTTGNTVKSTAGLFNYDTGMQFKAGNGGCTVYADSGLTKATGSLDPSEECYILSKWGGLAVVEYKVNSGGWKVGYVKL